VNSFAASSIVSPSRYGQGYHAWRCPGATSGSKNVCISTYRAAASGRARSRRALNLESGPRDRHRPSFDAAVPVDALLERHAPQQSVDVNGHFLFDQSINVHRPRPDSKGLRRAGDTLVRTEFVKIVVARRMSLGCKRPINLIKMARQKGFSQQPPTL